MKGTIDTIDAILGFWFGVLDDQGMSTPQQQKMWFAGGVDIDRQCREQFGDEVAAAVAGELGEWAQSDRGLMALVLLLDQFTRNIYRGTPAAFAGDDRALALVEEAVAAGRQRRLPIIHQVFLYVPFEHSESLAVQHAGVALFDALVARSARTEVIGFRDYAMAHRDVIARFGRFPHRNAIVGRESTPEEVDYLAVHGGF